MTRSLLVHAAALAVVLLVPTVASADSYLVTSCRDPLGQPNPAVGWVASNSTGGLTGNTCATANGMLKADLLGATPPPSSDAAWRFTAPPGTRIVRVLATRNTRNVSQTPTSPDVIYQLTADDRTLEECRPDLSCVNNLLGPVDKQGLNAGRIEFRVLCGDGSRPCSRPLGLDVSAAWVSLEDAAAPAVSNATVVDDGETSGVLRATFNATDAGGGLYRALVKVDGKVTQAIPLAPAPCSDVAPADANPYQFNVPVPCPPAVNGAAVAVDASKLTPGPHGVEIAVEDAAGNQTVVVGAIEFPRPNVASGSAADRAAALAGRLNMWFVKSKTRTRRSYTSRYGNRVVTRGLLRTRRGRGIVGARIDVYHIRRDGSRRLVKTGLKSRSGGKLTLILPNNVDTRTIEFAYRALRPGPITSRQRLRLTVRDKNGRIYQRKGRSR